MAENVQPLSVMLDDQVLRRERSLWGNTWRRFARNRAALVGWGCRAVQFKDKKVPAPNESMSVESFRCRIKTAAALIQRMARYDY